jgi:hypothetical protein
MNHLTSAWHYRSFPLGLAGELMAEVLGYFPWEFERMFENVIAFERAIGMPEKKIAR